MTIYHNTNLLTKKELISAEKRASTETDMVYSHFKFCPGQYFTPDEIRERMHLPEIKIIGIRRAITNLTAEGYLRKTDKMGIGTSGVKCHTWVLNESRGEQVRIFKIW
jgi:predicted HTH transcriptional regulator